MPDTRDPRPPRWRPVQFGPLRRFPADEVDGDSDLDEVELRELTVAAMAWSGRRRLRSAALDQLTIGHLEAPGSGLVDSRVSRLDVPTWSASGCGWRHTELADSRIGSAEFYDGVWREVRITGCKLGFVNLRHSSLTDVSFADCTIEELDLKEATATRLSFTQCRIGRLELAGATLGAVDLRGASISEVSGLSGLRGATLSYDQILDLAPAIAGELGIQIA